VPPFRLVVFDLDGTLIDSRRDLTDSVNALLVECGAAALPENEVGRMVGDGAATLVARAFAARGIAKPDDALPRSWRSISNDSRITPNPTTGFLRCSRRSRRTRLSLC
jgi:phosphoglycolate phosphatase-like HAD superfamily hydrolase